MALHIQFKAELVIDKPRVDKNVELLSIVARLAGYYNKYSSTLKSFVARIEGNDSKTPKIVSINEFQNGEININSGLKRITINFDRTLLGQGHSINYGNKVQIGFP